MAYCLMGLFDVNMPLLYGEGSRAFLRLQEQAFVRREDYTIFLWTSVQRSQFVGYDTRCLVLRVHPADFGPQNTVVFKAEVGVPQSTSLKWSSVKSVYKRRRLDGRAASLWGEPAIVTTRGLRVKLWTSVEKLRGGDRLVWTHCIHDQMAVCFYLNEGPNLSSLRCAADKLECIPTEELNEFELVEFYLKISPEYNASIGWTETRDLLLVYSNERIANNVATQQWTAEHQTEIYLRDIRPDSIFYSSDMKGRQKGGTIHILRHLLNRTRPCFGGEEIYMALLFSFHHGQPQEAKPLAIILGPKGYNMWCAVEKDPELITQLDNRGFDRVDWEDWIQSMIKGGCFLSNRATVRLSAKEYLSVSLKQNRSETAVLRLDLKSW
ncbi:hypothetical protein BJ170DRAFT_239888 [Xylariales sp. AK1849]|nr:hypothetical protein BJ170DRAFT_239888 [Xylariales sp. AK1849]